MARFGLVSALVVVGCMPRPKGSFLADLVCSLELVSRPHGLGFESLRLLVLAETQVGHLARVWLGKPTRITCNVMIFLVVIFMLLLLLL